MDVPEQYQHLFGRLLEVANDIVWVASVDGQLVYVNPAIERVYGRPREAFLKNPTLWFDVIHPGDQEIVRRHTILVLEQGQTELEYRIVRPDGSIRWLLDQRSVLYSEAGQPAHIGGISTDRTAHKQAERSQQFLDEAINSLQGVFYLFDEQGRFLRWNKQFERASGYSTEEIAGRHPLDFFDDRDKQRVAERIRQCFEQGSATVQADVVSKDGQRTPYLFTGRRIILDQKPYLVGMGVDISQLKQLEQEQQRLLAAERQQRMRAEALTEVTLALTSQLDHATILDEVLRQVQRLLPQVAAHIALIEGDILRVVHWKGYTAHGGEACLDGLLQPLTAFPIDLEAMRTRRPTIVADTRQDPGWVVFDDFAWVRSHLVIPICLGDDVLGVLRLDSATPNQFSLEEAHALQPLVNAAAIALEHARLFQRAQQELDERRQAEQVLQRQSQLMQAILEHIPFGYIYVEAPSGRILTHNAKAEQILGHPIIPVTSVAEYAVYGAFHNNGQPFAADDYPVAQVLKTGKPALNVETHYRRGDSTVVRLRNSAVPVKNAQGEMIGVVNLFEDVTERRSLEEQLRQTQKMEAIGQLAGGIAHDLNNLLVPILGYVELAMVDLALESKLYHDLTQVKRAADQATELTRQILAFSRRQVMEVQQLNLNDVILDFKKMLQRLIGEDIELQTLLTPGLHPVKGDKGQIEQVLMNLALNARDAMPKGGKLTIETANVLLDAVSIAQHAEAQKPGEYVLLAMSDTGHGMDAETQKRIFEPFFTTKERGKGTGLGLAMVLGIVKQHQGSIWVYSEPGCGTSFKIYLPRTEETAHRASAAPLLSGSVHGQETVLVVEDEEMVRTFVCETLRSYGYQVIEAKSPAEGLRIALNYQGPLHLLLTDVVMPEMNGNALYHKVFAVHPECRVLYMSGYTDNVIIHHGILDEGINFLQKPFTIQSLTRKIRQVLGPPVE